MSDVKKLITRYGECCAATARTNISVQNMPRIEVDHEVLRDCERAEAEAGAALEAELVRLKGEQNQLLAAVTRIAQESGAVSHGGEAYFKYHDMIRIARSTLAALAGEVPK